MPQIAGLRGVLPDPSKLKEATAAAAGASVGFDVPRGLAAGTLARDPGRSLYRYHQAFADPAGSRMLVRKMIVCSVRRGMSRADRHEFRALRTASRSVAITSS